MASLQPSFKRFQRDRDLFQASGHLGQHLLAGHVDLPAVDLRGSHVLRNAQRHGSMALNMEWDLACIMISSPVIDGKVNHH